MKILTYHELDEKETLIPLMDQAFRWIFTPEQLERNIKKDARLRGTPVGYAAVEGSRVVGFVGVMDLRTRNLEGETEPVGGVWGVATLPSHVKKKIATNLMKKAHEYFREKGYRFAFLCTSRVIVAYALYRKFGYIDAASFPSAYKLVTKPKGKHKTKHVAGKKTASLDWNKILEIYNKFSIGKTGLVIRDKQYLEMVRKREHLRSANFIVLEDGYAVFKKNRGILEVVEIAANSKETTKKLLAMLEAKAKTVICDRMVLDSITFDVYKALGYHVERESHDLIMAASLENAEFEQVYGDKFHMTNLDMF